MTVDSRQSTVYTTPSTARGEGRVTKAKAEELSPVSDEELSEELEDVSEDSDIGDVSEDEVAASSDNSEDLSEIDSDEELRLTSTDEEGEKKGAGGKKGKRSREEKEKVRERKVRGLQREIARAERVAARERAERKRSVGSCWRTFVMMESVQESGEEGGGWRQQEGAVGVPGGEGEDAYWLLQRQGLLRQEEEGRGRVWGRRMSLDSVGWALSINRH